MNKYFLSAILSCMVLLGTAKEYVFDLREATIPTTGNSLVMTSDDGEVTFTITIPTNERTDPSHTYSMSDCVYDSETGRLKIIWGNGASVRATQNMGRNLNFVELGEWTNAATGENFIFRDAHISPDRITRIMDYIPNGDEEKATALNHFNLKNRGDKTEMYSAFTSYEDCFEVWVGPTFVVRDERITLEDLTFADHAVKDFYHTITDDLVGVMVETVTGGVGELLFCRSAQPISANHKHGLQPGQELWERDGVVPAYADPTTVQYAWIALKVADPEQYVGKRFNNVRGHYCAETGREKGNYFGWLNPNMEVVSTPEILESGIETTPNTYCVANFSEQDDQHYFFLEPRPCEVCNVVEAMRTGNDVILVPTANAITPDGNEDFVEDQIEGGTAFFNGYGIGTPPYGPYGSYPDKIYAYKDVDQEYCEHTWDVPTQFAWRSYFKLFDFTNLIAICFSNVQLNDTHHDYPLDTPNSYYDQDQPAILFGLMGTGDTHCDPSGDYDEDFFVGYSDYYSRYDWHRDVNVYKNDMHINVIEHPHEGQDHLDAYGDIDLMRCDYAGHPLAKVATLKLLSSGQYKVIYNTASQTAVNNGVVDEMLIENGQVLGLPVADNQVFDIYAQTTEGDNQSAASISFSDCFLSEQMLTRSSIAQMNADYTYRLYAEGNGEEIHGAEIHAILSHVPVYLIPYNEVWRASLTKEEVDADLDGALALTEDLHIKFSSNTDHHVLTYHLLEGHGGNEEHEVDHIDADHPNHDPNSHEANAYDGYEHYDQHENSGLIGWDGLWFVPEIESDHNGNTYGCYKETINRAYVYLDRDVTSPNTQLGISSLELTDENDAHYRYFHTSLRLWSRQEISENANPEERYLYRVWREVKPSDDGDNGSNAAPRRANTDGASNRVLLNTASEFDENLITVDEFYYWATDYAGLQEFTGEDIKISDTFLNEVPADTEEFENFILDVDYHAVLYVHDTVEDLYYPVASQIVPIRWDLGSHTVVTGLKSIDADNRTVAGVEYYDVTGRRLASPHGMTIVVTRFSDGSVVSTKQMFK